MIISVPNSLNLSHRSLFSKWHMTRDNSSQLHRGLSPSAKGFGPGVDEEDFSLPASVLSSVSPLEAPLESLRDLFPEWWSSLDSAVISEEQEGEQEFSSNVMSRVGDGVGLLPPLPSISLVFWFFDRQSVVVFFESFIILLVGGGLEESQSLSQDVEGEKGGDDVFRFTTSVETSKSQIVLEA